MPSAAQFPRVVIRGWEAFLASALGATIVLLTAGCPTTPSPTVEDGATPPPPATLTVWVVDDAEIAQALAREWQANTRAEVVVRQISAADLHGLKRIEADVIIYPPRLMGELVANRFILPLPRAVIDDADWAANDVLPAVRRRELTWGEETFAVPFGAQPFVLAYRADLLDKIERQPPRTWEEYREVAALLAQLPEAERDGAAADSAAWRGAAEPLAPEWIGLWFLARAAAYAQHPSNYSTTFDVDTGKPLIDGPPFARALDDFRAMADYLPFDAPLTPEQTLARLFEGKCGMAVGILKMENAGAKNENAAASLPDHARIAFAPLPGSREAYNYYRKAWEARGEGEALGVPLLGVEGRYGSVVRGTRNASDATRMLQWLTGQKWGATIARESRHTLPYRESQLEPLPQFREWLGPLPASADAAGFRDTLRAVQSSRRSMHAPRLPGEADYLQSLGNNVAQAVYPWPMGEDTRPPSAEILAKVAEEWQAISERLGIDQQRKWYRQSIGMVD